MNKLTQKLKVGLSSLLLLGATVAVQAQVIAYDGFNGSTEFNGGSGWAADWGPGINSSTNLTYSNLATTGTGAGIKFYGDGQSTRSFTPTSGTVWFSWVQNGGTTAGGIEQIRIMNTGGQAFVIGKHFDDNFFKIYNGDADGFAARVASTVAITGTHFVVASIDLATSLINLYIDPTGLGMGAAPTSAPSATFPRGGVTADITGIQSVGEGNPFTWDEVRVGNTWADVSPTAAPVETDMFWSNMGSEWGEPAARAFDGIRETTWSQKSGTGWIGGKYVTPVKFNKVVITSPADGFNDLNSGVPLNQTPRVFKDWVLKASNDTLAGWVTLDTRAGELFEKAATATIVSKVYTFTNEVEYKYYRFYFTNNSNAYTQMGELALSYAIPETDMFWSNMGSEWGEPAARAFDGVRETTWSQKSGTGWIGGKYVTPVKFNKVVITSPADGFNDLNSGVPLNQTPRVFKDWVLKASNDTLAGWVTLDTRAGELFEKAATATIVSKVYTFTNEVEYKYYRFEFTNNSNAYTQMGELALSYVAPETDMFWSNMGSEWGEPAARAFDGVRETTWSQKSGTGWIGGKYATPVKYNKVVLTSPADGFNDPNSGVPLNQTPRVFKDWELKASNDTLAGWVTLDTRAGQLFEKAATATIVSKVYTFNNEVAYKYYRFYFTNNSNTYTQMGELALSYVVTTPISSQTLTGTEVNNGVKLSWTTFGEVNTSKFDVQRRNAAGNFVTIGSVASIKNGNGSYSFFDNSPAAGDNYYRLKNVDQDGSSTISDVKLVKVSSLASSVSVYPNPVSNGTFTVAAAGTVQSVSVYSVGTGVKVISNKYSTSGNSVQVNVQSLSKGLYIVEIVSNSVVTTKKIIVQ